MKKISTSLLGVLALFSTLNPQLSTAFAQGTAFTYQGRLNFNDSPAAGNYDLAFTLLATNTTGTAIATPVTNSATAVTNGLFTVTLDFGAGIFTGPNRWLEIAARTNGNGTFNTLAPRQMVTPTPYAIFANSASNVSGTISAAQISGGTIGNSLLPASPNFSGTVTANQISGNGASVTNVNAVLLDGISATNFWQTGGNAGTSPANGNYLGTTDNEPLELWVNNSRGLRIEPAGDAPNLIGGAPENFVAPGVIGSTVGGGGVCLDTLGDYWTNQISANYGVIGGGAGNDIEQSSDWSTVGGGQLNIVRNNSQCSSIGGGFFNIIEANSETATIGGGFLNYAFGQYATIGGGLESDADGNGSTVPGGYYNHASGYCSFAAGVAAGAVHDSTFVWSDNQPTAFESTVTNEFSIRALNGVRIQSDTGVHLNAGNNPLIVRDWDVFSTNAPKYKAGIGRWGLFMEPYALTIGIPGDDLSGRSFQIAKYNTNGLPTTLLSVDQGGGVVFNAGTNNVEIASGGLKVTGAGIGASTTAFIQRATSANIDPAGLHRTTINNPYCNGNANALLFVTANYNPGITGDIIQNHPYGVYYNPALAKWQIFNEDFAALTTNTAFNVMIVVP